MPHHIINLNLTNYPKKQFSDNKQNTGYKDKKNLTIKLRGKNALSEINSKQQRKAKK